MTIAIGKDGLTAIERSELSSLEVVIEKGIGEFVAVGRALLRIRDGKLYRESHKSFDAYCRERWEFGDKYAHRLIEGAEIVGRIASNGVLEDKNPPESARTVAHGASKSSSGILPRSEATARPLAKLPADEQKSAWEESVRTAPKSTSGKPKPSRKHVEKVVAKRIADKTTSDKPSPGKPAPQLTVSTTVANQDSDSGDEWPVDEVGIAVTDDLRETFQNRNRFDRALSLLSQLRKEINPIVGDAESVKPVPGGERLASERQTIINTLNSARSLLNAAKPYAVCPYCKGSIKYGGSACSCKLGWVAKSVYDAAPSEMKAKKK